MVGDGGRSDVVSRMGFLNPGFQVISCLNDPALTLSLLDRLGGFRFVGDGRLFTACACGSGVGLLDT